MYQVARLVNLTNESKFTSRGEILRSYFSSLPTHVTCRLTTVTILFPSTQLSVSTPALFTPKFPLLRPNHPQPFPPPSSRSSGSTIRNRFHPPSKFSLIRHHHPQPVPPRTFHLICFQITFSLFRSLLILVIHPTTLSSRSYSIHRHHSHCSKTGVSLFERIYE